jgi:hypothetical protein
MLGDIVIMRSEEHHIDWQARHRAGVFDFHFDPSHDTWQSA